MANFKWIVEFEIHETWVADGFMMTDRRAQDMIQTELGWATEHEVSAKVILHPNLDKVAKAQGYKNAKAMLAHDPKLAADLLID